MQTQFLPSPPNKTSSVHSRLKAKYSAPINSKIGEALLICLRISLCEVNVKRAFPGNLDAYDFKLRAYLQVGTSHISFACYAFKSRYSKIYLRTCSLLRTPAGSIYH